MSDLTPYSRRPPLEHERDEGGMSDELVKRLMAALTRTEFFKCADAMCREAADRIEALEAENARLRAALDLTVYKKPVRYCARCNAPENNHPYRHPFVGRAQEAVKAPAPRPWIVTEPHTTLYPDKAWRSYCLGRPAIGVHYAKTEEGARNKCAAALAQEGEG